MQIGSTIIKDNSLILNVDGQNLKSYPLSGTIWKDLSGNKNNGTLVNTTFSGNSMNFNGTSSIITTPSSTIKNDTDSYSITGWLTPSVSGITYAFLRGNDGGFGTGWSIYATLTTTVVAGAVVVNGSQFSNNFATTLNVNTFYHLGLSYSRSEGLLRLYLNGQVLPSISCPVNGLLRSSTLGFIFGRVNPSTFFSGKIGMCQFYNRVLSNQEILQNYNATKSRYGL